jgi:hypothetical protein
MQMKTKEIEIFDSLNIGTRSKSLDKLPIEVPPLVDLLLAEEKFLSESKILQQEWSYYYSQCPQQPNAYDLVRISVFLSWQIH